MILPPPIWRCWTVPARVVRAVPRVARAVLAVATSTVVATVPLRHVRRVVARHAFALGAAAVVAVPATLVCVMVPGWLAGTPEGAGGGASSVWYGSPGGPSFGGVPEGGVAFAGVGEFGGCCGTEEERRHHHHHHHHEHRTVRIPEPSSLALFGFGAATLMWLRRPRVPPVPTLLPALAQLERDIADARCDLGADVVAIDPVLAEHGRRLAEEMGDKS